MAQISKHFGRLEKQLSPVFQYDEIIQEFRNIAGEKALQTETEKTRTTLKLLNKCR